MCIPNLFIFLLSAWLSMFLAKCLAIDLLLIAFDERIARICKSATILTIATPMMKLIEAVVQRCSVNKKCP